MIHKYGVLPNGRRFQGEILIEKGYDGKWYATNASLGPIEGFVQRIAAERFKRQILEYVEASKAEA